MGVGRIEVRVLGPLEVLGGRGQVRLPRGRARSLLALLLIRAGEAVPIDRLVDALWGEAPPPTARSKIHGLVSNLRRHVGMAHPSGDGANVIVTRAGGYALDAGRVEIDAHAFRNRVEDARRAALVERARTLRDAISLWRGAAYADVTYEPFAQAEIASLHELKLIAIEERIGAELELGRHRDVLDELHALTREHPLREKLREQWILALHGSGRRAQALAAYEDARRLFEEEFGMDPGPALQALHRAISRGDPMPEVPPTRAPASGRGHPGRATERAWLPSMRKDVTVVFTELICTAADGSPVDPETSRRALAPAWAAAAATVGRHGGSVSEPIGGVMVALFGVPVAHEDDAIRALRAAEAVRRDVREHDAAGARPVGIGVAARSGIETGELVLAEADLDATAPASPHGDSVRVTALLQQSAAPDEILIGEEARERMADAVVLDADRPPVRDASGRRVAAWRVRGMHDAATDVAHPVRTSFVGRRAELDRLRAAHDAAVRERHAMLVTVIGEPGIGKTRLAREFALGRVDSQVLTGRCPAYGEGITFWPLREIVLQACGSGEPAAIARLLEGEPGGEADARRIAGAIGGSGESGSLPDLFPAVRRMVERVAQRSPLVLVFEDVHWGEEALLDLVRHLAEHVAAPRLVVCLARPELHDRRPRWPRMRGARSIRLAPLEPSESRALVASRIARPARSDDVVRRIVGMARGNPLFLEQIAASFRSDSGDVDVPASLRALLASRLDRLGPAERDALRCASVIGEAFSRGALRAIVPDAARPHLDRHLAALTAKELVRPSSASLFGGSGLEFRHDLIQRAAYRSVTRAARAELHEALAEWLGEAGRDAPNPFDEMIGYHLEQAFEARRALELDHEKSLDLARRAGELLGRGGIRAFARIDVAAAVNLLGRAKALLPDAHPLRAEVVQLLQQAFQIAGELGRAEAVLAELHDPSGAADDHASRALRLERLRIRIFAGPDPVPLREIRAEAERALKVAQAGGDDDGIALATDLLAQVHHFEGRATRMASIARLGAEHARRTGNVRPVLAAHNWLALAAAMGPTPVPECIELCEGLAVWNGTEHALVVALLGPLRAMRRDFAAARKAASRARTLVVENVRARRPLMFTWLYSGEVELLAGDVATATAHFREALGLAEAMKASQAAAQAYGSLALAATPRPDALAHVPAERLDEAERFADRARASAPAEDVHIQSLWRAAKARVLASRGSLADAEALARASLALLPEDMPSARADRAVDLAVVLSAAGKRSEAEARVGHAVGLYRRKGNLVGAERAAAVLR